MTAVGYAATVMSVGSTPPGTGDPVQFNPPELNPAAPAYPPWRGPPLHPVGRLPLRAPQLSTHPRSVHTSAVTPRCRSLR